MNEKLQEAVSLYNIGDKSQASKLLIEIVREEPSNSVAWYGLALCLDDSTKKIYCLKKVLSLEPSHKKAQQSLEKLQPKEESPSYEEFISSPQSLPVTKKKSSFNWLPIVILGAIGMILIGVIIGAALIGMNPFKPAPTSTPISPTSIPRPSSTSIFTTKLTEYLPNLPDNFVLDSQKEFTKDGDGARYLSLRFKNIQNIQAEHHGDLVNVLYFISLFPSETTAISQYRKDVNELKSDGPGTLKDDITIDGTETSTIYMEINDDKTLVGQYTSRVKNVIVTTIGLTIYDSQDISAEFLKKFMADVLAFHILEINKFSK